jgi:mono/diheme cytochrome c family protein
MMRLAGSCVLLFVLSCHKEPKPPPETPAAAEARKAFHTFCVPCHGETGRGDGPAAASLNPKPRNYTDKAWQKSVTDSHIKQIILNGGASVGKSPLMPAWQQFNGQPEVLEELVHIVRGFGK